MVICVMHYGVCVLLVKARYRCIPQHRNAVYPSVNIMMDLVRCIDSEIQKESENWFSDTFIERCSEADIACHVHDHNLTKQNDKKLVEPRINAATVGRVYASGREHKDRKLVEPRINAAIVGRVYASGMEHKRGRSCLGYT